MIIKSKLKLGKTLSLISLFEEDILVANGTSDSEFLVAIEVLKTLKLIYFTSLPSLVIYVGLYYV